LLLACVPAYIFATETSSEPTGEETGTTTEAPATEPTDAEGYVNDVSQELLDVLKKLEGYTQYCFWDYQQMSIGYGTVCPGGRTQHAAGSHSLTEEEAEAALHSELQGFVNEVYSFSKRYQIKFKQHEFDALVCFSYNVGASWATDTTNGLHQALQAGATGSAMVYRILLYGSAGKEYILLGRRTVEANMFINGVYSQSPYDSATYPPNYRYVFVDGAGGAVNYRVHGFDANEPLPVMTKIKTNPKDPYGNDCVFDGWYTQRDGGTRIEALDSTFEKGDVIYAHWKTSRGEPIVIPEREYFRLEVTVTGNNVNLRTGPQTYYKILGKAAAGEKLQVTQIAKGDSMKWGKTERGWIALKYTDYDAVMGAMSEKGKVIADGVNVRKGPGTGYAAYEEKKNTGDEVTITALEVSEYFENGTLMTWGKIGNDQWICLDFVTYDEIPGDLDNNGAVDDRDAVRLLMYYLFPNDYIIHGDGDTNGDGAVDDRDAVHLLMHYLFPGDYPLYPTSQ
jgi:GH24 family phage-related lysozyme (muramidase)/uncharacterized protein YraI